MPRQDSRDTDTVPSTSAASHSPPTSASWYHWGARPRADPPWWDTRILPACWCGEMIRMSVSVECAGPDNNRKMFVSVVKLKNICDEQLTLKQELMSASVCWGTVNMSTAPSSIVFSVTMSMKPSSRYVMFSLQVVVYFIFKPADISLVFWKLTLMLLGVLHVIVPLHLSSFRSTRVVWWVEGSMWRTVVPAWASCKEEKLMEPGNSDTRLIPWGLSSFILSKSWSPEVCVLKVWNFL